MKFIKKNAKHLFYISLICMILGTLIFEMFVMILNSFGLVLPLSVGPIGFDFEVISFFIKINLGTLIGLGVGVLLFSRL